MRAAARLAREALRAGAAPAGNASRGLACSAGGRLAGALRTAAAAPRAAASAPPRAAAEAARGFACRTKFDAPPPKMASRSRGAAPGPVRRSRSRFRRADASHVLSTQVMIEYDPADVDSFIALADAVEARGCARCARVWRRGRLPVSSRINAV
jgi:hypothetical protein